jgi:hypothetical protein
MCLVPTNHHYFVNDVLDITQIIVGGCRDVDHNVACHTQPHHLARCASLLLRSSKSFKQTVLPSEPMRQEWCCSWQPGRQGIEHPTRLGLGLLLGIWHIDAKPTTSVVPSLRLMADSSWWQELHFLWNLRVCDYGNLPCWMARGALHAYIE